jgi:hypothetical protein
MGSYHSAAIKLQQRPIVRLILDFKKIDFPEHLKRAREMTFLEWLKRSDVAKAIATADARAIVELAQDFPPAVRRKIAELYALVGPVDIVELKNRARRAEIKERKRGRLSE